MGGKTKYKVKVKKRIYKDLLILIYANESWVCHKKTRKQNKVTEMKFIRTSGKTKWNRIRNEDFGGLV